MQRKNGAREAPAAYAIAQGVCTDSGNKTSEGKAAGGWWLRSSGSSQSRAAFVDADGSLSSTVDYGLEAVRPAFWLGLESGIF